MKSIVFLLVLRKAFCILSSEIANPWTHPELSVPGDRVEEYYVDGHLLNSFVWDSYGYLSIETYRTLNRNLTNLTMQKGFEVFVIVVDDIFDDWITFLKELYRKFETEQKIQRGFLCLLVTKTRQLQIYRGERTKVYLYQSSIDEIVLEADVSVKKAHWNSVAELLSESFSRHLSHYDFRGPLWILGFIGIYSLFIPYAIALCKLRDLKDKYMREKMAVRDDRIADTFQRSGDDVKFSMLCSLCGAVFSERRREIMDDYTKYMELKIDLRNMESSSSSITTSSASLINTTETPSTSLLLSSSSSSSTTTTTTTSSSSSSSLSLLSPQLLPQTEVKYHEAGTQTRTITEVKALGKAEELRARLLSKKRREFKKLAGAFQRYDWENMPKMEGKGEDVVSLLGCGHQYHSECLSKWIRTHPRPKGKSRTKAMLNRLWKKVSGKDNGKDMDEKEICPQCSKLDSEELMPTMSMSMPMAMMDSHF